MHLLEIDPALSRAVGDQEQVIGYDVIVEISYDPLECPHVGVVGCV